MHILLTDLNQVGETQSTLFELNQSAGVDLVMTLNNVGLNTMNYQVLACVDGVSYNVLGAAGTPFYSTLMAGQSRVVTVPAAVQRIRVVGNASGGAVLDFAIHRYYPRPPGGFIL